MINSIEALRYQKEKTGGFVKNDTVACYILDKSEGNFYLLSANRCVLLHLNFNAKSPFPAEPVQKKVSGHTKFSCKLINVRLFLWPKQS